MREGADGKMGGRGEGEGRREEGRDVPRLVTVLNRFPFGPEKAPRRSRRVMRRGGRIKVGL